MEADCSTDIAAEGSDLIRVSLRLAHTRRQISTVALTIDCYCVKYRRDCSRGQAYVAKPFSGAALLECN